jgi:hypothetical protein
MEELIYVERNADQELLNSIIKGNYCHVLAPPKTGKTELLRKARQSIEEYPHPEGTSYRCAYLSFKDLIASELGDRRNISETDWYGAFTRQLAKAFDLYNNSCEADDDYRRRRFARVPREALQVFIKDVLLEETSGKVVIFIDDIEEILSLSLSSQQASGFRNNFFWTLGWFYDQRNTERFVLLRNVSGSLLSWRGKYSLGGLPQAKVALILRMSVSRSTSMTLICHNFKVMMKLIISLAILRPWALSSRKLKGIPI